jgi:hypothetical protein
MKNANRTDLACGSKESDPVSRFPRESRAGMLPPTPRTLIASKKRLQSSLPRLPPQEGFQNAPLKSPLRDSPCSVSPRHKPSPCGQECKVKNSLPK